MFPTSQSGDCGKGQESKKDVLHKYAGLVKKLPSDCAEFKELDYEGGKAALEEAVLKIKTMAEQVVNWKQTVHIDSLQREAAAALKVFDEKLASFEEIGAAVEAIRFDSQLIERKEKRKARTEQNKVSALMIKTGSPAVLANCCSHFWQRGWKETAYKTSKDMSSPCTFTQEDSVMPDFVKALTKLIDSNKGKVESKASSLKAKMKAKAALTNVNLAGDIPDFGGNDSKLQLHNDEAKAIFSKPFLVACQHHSWTWDFNAWPLPGTPSLVFGVQERVLICAIQIDKLKSLGVTALSALEAFLVSKSDNKSFLTDHVSAVLMVGPKDVVWLPAGWVPLVVGWPNDCDEKKTEDKDVNENGVAVSKSVVLVIPALIKGAMEKLGPSALDLKQYIDTLAANYMRTKTWEVTARAAKDWAAAMAANSGEPQPEK